MEQITNKRLTGTLLAKNGVVKLHEQQVHGFISTTVNTIVASANAWRGARTYRRLWRTKVYTQRTCTRLGTRFDVRLQDEAWRKEGELIASNLDRLLTPTI